MKKRILLIFSFLLLILSACVPDVPPLPTGVWRSESPDITLFITSDYRIRGSAIYPGFYTQRDTKTKIIAYQRNNWGFSITTTAALTESGGFAGLNNSLMRGSYSIVSDDEFHFTLAANSSTRRYYSVIVFHRVEEYDPIDVRDWGQHLENIEIWFPADEEEMYSRCIYEE